MYLNRANLIYLTYNSSADIPHLPALVSYAGDDLPVNAIDNASSDDSVERVSELGPSVVVNKENKGFTASINQGLRRCRGAEWAIIANPDVRVIQQDWLASLVDVDDDVGIVGARLTDGMEVLGGGVVQEHEGPLVRPLPQPVPNGEVLCDELLGWTRITQLHGGPESFTKPRDVAWVAFALVALRMKMVEEIGPLDENYWHYVSDHEYCLRAWIHDWRVRYQPVTFWHKGQTALKFAPPEVDEAIRKDIRQWCAAEGEYLRASKWA